MKHIQNYKLFELMTTPSLNRMDDIFAEFEDVEINNRHYKFRYSIDYNYVEIAKAVNTPSLIFGNNFIYPNITQRQYRQKPGIGYKEWKNGFIVKITCKNPDFNDSSNFFDDNSNRFYGDGGLEEVKLFLKNKAMVINRRCPKDIQLFGIKEVNVFREFEFEFAFIYI